MLYTVVMAGGQGTRFWPESTSKKPKQYLSLISENSLLTETLLRFEGIVPKEKRYIVTVKDQEALADDNSRGQIAEGGLIFEPAGRNTAPCILLALARLVKNGAQNDDVVAFVPSDHVILNKKGFQDTLKKASDLAVSSKNIVTIGIPPHFPHTGYGYIHRGESLEEVGYSVKAFKEKPDVTTAKSYLETGEYYWNAGMFVSTLGVLLGEFEAHASDMFKHFSELQDELDNFENLSVAYNKMPKDSIDYAVMEKTSKIAVVPAEFDWNDLGSWDALESVIEKKDQNTIAAARAHEFIDAKGNIVFAPDKFVSLIGVEDLIVVSNDHSVIVLPKERSQDVKKVVEKLKAQVDLKELT